MSSRYVALLRGVNVGGKNKLPMKDLVGIFSDAGCSEVRNYIQSGNVVFTATTALAKRISSLVEKQIEQRFGFSTRIIIRTAEQLRRVASNNPFLLKGSDEALLSVMFLADSPEPGAIAKLDPDRSAPDTYLVHEDAIFLCTPNGLAKTKLTNAYFDSKLGTVGTSRNWRTVLKLLEMMEG
jgi:uncharacterized protein (DUF1697 family)